MAEWGTVPDWVGAVGTTGAFVVALSLLGRELRASRQRDREKVRDAASQVSAWWEYDTSRAGEPVPTSGRLGVQSYFTGFWALKLRNGSAEPVYRCKVILGPAPNASDSPAEYFFPIVPPSQTVSDYIHEDEVAVWSNEDEQVMSKDVWVELFFTDPAGRRWHRTAAGALEEDQGLTETAPGRDSPDVREDRPRGEG